MEGKKISFGFKKTKKFEKVVLEEKKDFIECVEEKAIKVVGGDEVKENAPLVIPMKPNTLVTTERLKEIAQKVESALEEPEIAEEPPPTHENIPENETLEQMAIRELLEDSKKAVKVETPELKLLLPVKSVTSGEKESTLDDYESVPIQEYGLAMLRGMGWTKTNEKSTFKQPPLRPKGLGLGADKVVKDNQKQKGAKGNRDEELAIVKNAYVKITSGKYSGYYGKVLSLDEDNGRVLVEIEVKKITTSLSEFMMIPVSKSEYTKESKVINANSFEQYKKGEMGQKSSNNSDKDGSSRNSDRNREDKLRHQRDGNSSRHSNSDRQKERENHGDVRERNRDRSNRDKQRDSSEESSSQVRSQSRKTNKKYSSNESLSSDLDSERKRHKKKERRSKRSSSAESLDSHSDKERNRKKERRRRESDSETGQSRGKKTEKQQKGDSSDSESDHRRSKRSDTPEGKRDIDKKRKGKKKKRDRDRSPNHRKHRK